MSELRLNSVVRAGSSLSGGQLCPAGLRSVDRGSCGGDGLTVLLQ